MKSENLTGSLVLVHPDFKEDPIQKQGQVGVLTYPRSGSEIYVSFPGGGESVYSGDNLFKLKDRQQIADALTQKGSSMKLDDFKAMYKVMLLQDRETSRGTYDALEIARDHPGIWDRALDRLQQVQKLDLTKSYSR